MEDSRVDSRSCCFLQCKIVCSKTTVPSVLGGGYLRRTYLGRTCASELSPRPPLLLGVQRKVLSLFQVCCIAPSILLSYSSAFDVIFLSELSIRALPGLASNTPGPAVVPSLPAVFRTWPSYPTMATVSGKINITPFVKRIPRATWNGHTPLYGPGLRKRLPTLHSAHHSPRLYCPSPYLRWGMLSATCLGLSLYYYLTTKKATDIVFDLTLRISPPLLTRTQDTAWTFLYSFLLSVLLKIMC